MYFWDTTLVTGCLPVFPGIRCGTVPVFQAMDQLGSAIQIRRRVVDEDMAALLEKVDECDMVCGIRKGRKDGAVRIVCSRIANAFRNMVTGYPVVDSGCMFRVFRRECVPGLLLLEGKLFGCEMLFFPSFVMRGGFRVLEMPVSHHERNGGASKYRLIRGRLWRGFAATIAAQRMLRR